MFLFSTLLCFAFQLRMCRILLEMSEQLRLGTEDSIAVHAYSPRRLLTALGGFFGPLLFRLSELRTRGSVIKTGG